LKIFERGFDPETAKGPPRKCMAVNFLANELSDLCIGKPAVRSLPLSAATGDLAAALRRVSRSGAAACVAVTGPARAVVGRVGPADVLCLLCTDPEALARPAAVFSKPVSALLPKDGAGEVRRVDPRSRQGSTVNSYPSSALLGLCKRRVGFVRDWKNAKAVHHEETRFFGKKRNSLIKAAIEIDFMRQLSSLIMITWRAD
jgi:hypothetical protein